VALESIFEALETIFEVGLKFFGVSRFDLAGNEESPGDGLAGNGGSPER
jgi:hypothetical protein